MSYFLHYFEISNPNADWSTYNIKSKSIRDTFDNLLDENIPLLIQKHNVEYKGKIIESYIISDGVSSDRIFFKGKESSQKQFFIDFLAEREEIGKYISIFILKLQESNTFETVCIGSTLKVIHRSISELIKEDVILKNTIYMIGNLRY